MWMSAMDGGRERWKLDRIVLRLGDSQGRFTVYALYFALYEEYLCRHTPGPDESTPGLAVFPAPQ